MLWQLAVQDSGRRLSVADAKSERLKFELALRFWTIGYTNHLVQELQVILKICVFRSPKPDSSLIGFGSMEKSGKEPHRRNLS